MPPYSALGIETLATSHVATDHRRLQCWNTKHVYRETPGVFEWLLIALETGEFMNNTAPQFHLFILGSILSYNIHLKCYFVSGFPVCINTINYIDTNFNWPVFSFCCWAKPILSLIKLHPYKMKHHLFNCPRYKAYKQDTYFMWAHPYLSVL